MENYPKEFEEDLIVLKSRTVHIRPEKPAQRFLLERHAFHTACATLLSCAIFAGLLSILP